MTRTVEQIDIELLEAVDTRRRARAALATGGGLTASGKDSLTVRIELTDERIEKLLDERSQALLLSQLAKL